MPFTSVFDLQNDYLKVTTSGSLASVQELEQYAQGIRQEALLHDAKRVHLDERKLLDEQDTLEAYEFSESDTTALTALDGIRISCVCHPDNYELNKTYETLYLNRSLMFRVFLTEEEALEWLLS